MTVVAARKRTHDGAPDHATRGRSRRPDLRVLLAAHAVLAAVVYPALLLTRTGRVGADTKTYLYLDPGRLLGRAWSMWDPNIGMGTVSHQTIGYLFPMGPYYWVMERLGVPDWVAQRLWLATLLFAAGAGVLWLLRTLGWRVVPALVAALAYMLTPYWLDYAARISAILLPWAGLPWMIGLTIRSLRDGGWRHPALFALVVALVGGVNATALLYAGIAPILWIAYAVVTREAPLGRAVGATLRIGALTLLTSLWWIAGLAVQGAYGVDILRYTETIPTVARTSLASEVFRGLGYWFFYGRDKLGPWIQPAVDYTQRVWLILVSFAVPALALLAGAVTRFRERVYFIALVLVGAVLAVGAYPYDDPSPLGKAFKAAAEGSTAGLAMRSTARAVPLVALGLAVLLGAGLAALARRLRVAGAVGAVLVGGLVLANQPSLFAGHIVDPNLDRAEDVPAYWHEAAAYLDRGPHSTRALELPGADFAAYRWGNTVDPVTPGLMDRPYVARELIPYGGPGTADLLNALDRRFQEGVYEPAALAPIARLMGVGDVVARNDLQFERYNTPRPKAFWQSLVGTPGLGPPTAFGPARPNTPVVFPMLDEQALGTPPSVPDPPEVGVLPVDGARPIVRAEAPQRAVVVAGDGEGMVDAAASGLLDGDGPVVYSASGVDPAAAPDLILTDTNRRRARRWSTVRDNTGYTETAGETPLVKDAGDARLDVFPPSATDATRTVVQLGGGVAQAQASHYGNPVSYTGEDRARNAVDGDPLTAWRVGAFDKVDGERLVVTLDHAVTTDHVTITQPINGPRNRYLTRVRLTFDDGRRGSVDADLGPASRELGGQRVSIGPRRFRKVEVKILADNFGRRASYIGLSAAGIAELGIEGATAHETVRLPQDLLRRWPGSDRRLAVVLTRLRTAPVPPRTDEELRLSREFELPTARSFLVRGTARLSGVVTDGVLDATLGQSGVVARSSSRLPGLLAARASSAIDGDPATAWTSAFGTPELQALDLTSPRRVRFDRLHLVVRADGRHSVPTRLRLTGDDGAPFEVAVPAIADRPQPDAVATVDVPLGRTLSTRHVRVETIGTRVVWTKDYYSEAPIKMPVSIAELGIPGLQVARPSGAFDSRCRSDLVTVDGRPYPVRLVGTKAAAEAHDPLTVEGCADLALAAGSHTVLTAIGRDLGIDVDRLVLTSGPGGAAAPWQRPPSTDTPKVKVLGTTRTSFHLRVDGAVAGQPFWLVLGQSRNDGWRASGAAGLGTPVLIDGYANGWLVRPTSTGPLDLRLRWTPQRGVNLALALSALGLLLCLVLAVVAPRRGTRVALEPSPPTLALLAAGDGPGVVRGAAAAIVTAAAVAVVATPWIGLVAGVAVAVSLAVRWVRPSVAIASSALVGLAGLYTALAQHRNHYPPEFEWPTFFSKAHTLALLALGLLAADAAVELVRRRPWATVAEPPSRSSDGDRVPKSEKAAEGGPG